MPDDATDVADANDAIDASRCDAREDLDATLAPELAIELVDAGFDEDERVISFDDDDDPEIEDIDLDDLVAMEGAD